MQENAGRLRPQHDQNEADFSSDSKWVKNPNIDRYRRSFVIVKLRKIRQQHAPCGSFGLFFFFFFDWIFCVCSVLGLKPLEQSDVLQFSDTTDELYMFLILVFTLHTFKVQKKINNKNNITWRSTTGVKKSSSIYELKNRHPLKPGASIQHIPHLSYFPAVSPLVQEEPLILRSAASASALFLNIFQYNAESGENISLRIAVIRTWGSLVA